MERAMKIPVRLRRHAPQMIKFCVTGGIAAVIDLGTSTLLHERYAVSVPVSYICSTLLAVLFVFFMNKRFTFGNRETDTGKQLSKFLLVYGGAIILNFAISTGLFSLGVEYRIAKMIAIGIGAVINYILSHSFVFKKKV